MKVCVGESVCGWLDEMMDDYVGVLIMQKNSRGVMRDEYARPHNYNRQWHKAVSERILLSSQWEFACGSSG